MEAHAQMGPRTPKGPGETYKGYKRKEKGEKWKLIMVKKKNASSSTNITEPTCTKKIIRGIKM